MTMKKSLRYLTLGLALAAGLVAACASDETPMNMESIKLVDWMNDQFSNRTNDETLPDVRVGEITIVDTEEPKAFDNLVDSP
jgi:hypothetical protein